MELWTILLIIAFAIVVFVLILMRLYVKTPANMAFIRTGLGGKKVVVDGGAIVLPIVQNIQWISLETFKLEVFKANKEAFITKDRFRVDIGAEFYVKVEPNAASIEQASRSLGDKSFSAGGIKTLLDEKLISALRSVSANMEMIELHENRRGFAKAVMENLKEALSHNGLTLEDVSIFYLDQTDKNQLDPNNIFDAEGLRQITAQTSERMRERNEIERNTEVAIRRKDVEAVKLKLALDQERSFAETEQLYRIETDRSKRMAEIEQFKAEQERLAREAEIAKEKAIREAEIKREAYLVQQMKLKEVVEVEKEKAIEEVRRERDIAILEKEKDKLVKEAERLQADAAREEMAQMVVTVSEKAKAERTKQLALIEALKELEVAERRAHAVEITANSRMKEGEAEAYACLKLREAENAVDEKIIHRDIMLELINKSPQILSELMAPAKNIESIKVLDINGWRPSGEGNASATSGSSGVMNVVNAILNAGAALPLLREILEFSKVDNTIIEKVSNYIPGLRGGKKSGE